MVDFVAVKSIYRETAAHQCSTSEDDQENDQGGADSEAHVVSLFEHVCGAISEVHLVEATTSKSRTICTLNWAFLDYMCGE